MTTFAKPTHVQRRIKAAALSVFLAASTSGVFAQSNDGTLSVGLKTWVADWHGSHAPLVGGTHLLEQLKTSSPKTVWIPSIQYKKGDFGVSASVLAEADFNLRSTSISGSFSRSEYDVSGQYFLLPNVALSAGYKQVKFGGGSPAKGPFVGVSASAPISGAFSLYASFGVGALKLVGYDTSYQVGEAGVAYALGGVGTFVKSSAITAGYRTQSLKADNILFPTGQRLNFSDTTNGLVLSLVASF